MAAATTTNEFVKIKVLFFASAREAANVSETQVELASSSADTAALRTTLAETFPALSAMVLDEENVTLALNEEYVVEGQVLPLKTGDVVALIPPISGG